MDDAYRDSLTRRLRAVHSLYLDAVASMTLDHVNTVFPDYPATLPIAFSLVHQLLIEDFSLAMLGGPGPHISDEWLALAGLGVAHHGKRRPVSEMVHQRIGDYELFQDMQATVFRATEEFAASVDASTFDDIIVRPPYPAEVAETYSARVGGDLGISRSDAFECWIYQHALRHMGEIEHARSMVGLEGMTS